jgi:hypothetical protein
MPEGMAAFPFGKMILPVLPALLPTGMAYWPCIDLVDKRWGDA